MSAPLFHMFSAAPAAVAPYSHAVEDAGWVFLTGQIPNHPDDDAAPIPGDIESQTRRTMENLQIVLSELGLGLEHLVAVRVFLTEFQRDYGAMNEIYKTYFEDGPPVRATVEGDIAIPDALVEISMVAASTA